MCAPNGKRQGRENSICQCNAPRPDSAHWAWECRRTTGGRDINRQKPSHEEGGRKLCVPLVERPARGWTDHDWAPVEGLRVAVQCKVCKQGQAIIATDERAKGKDWHCHVGTYGIAGSAFDDGARMVGLSQFPYTGELWALLKTMTSMSGINDEILIIIDNMAVAEDADLRSKGKVAAAASCAELHQIVGRHTRPCGNINAGWSPPPQESSVGCPCRP